MNPDATRCPACGHITDAAPCSRCHGTLVCLHDGVPFRPGRGFAGFDLLRGGFRFFASALNLLHRREFVGKLQLPVAANLLVVGGLLAACWFALRPMYASWLASGGLPGGADKDTGALWLCLATLWWLGPVVLEVALGPLVEPLGEIAEVRIGGPGMRVLRQNGFDELRRRVRLSARVFTLQLLTLPLAWLLAIVPAIGPPLVLLFSSVGAAVVWFALPMARRQLPLRQRLLLLRRNWAFALGFGLACQFAWLVPFLNLLFLAPASAVGAAAAWFRLDKLVPEPPEPDIEPREAR